MTDKEFEVDTFTSKDTITVRHFLRTRTEPIEWVDFDRRLVNGYRIADIIEHHHGRKEK